VGIRLIIVGMVENEQGYEDFTDTSVHQSLIKRNSLMRSVALPLIVGAQLILSIHNIETRRG